MAVRTWAPRGQTPVLRVKLTHDHLSAISGITPDGRLCMQMQDHAYSSEDVVRFLRLLLRKLTGKLLVIWDGAPIHRGQAVKAFLRRKAAKRLQLVQLPGYAPELNPDEGIWNLSQAGGTQKCLLSGSHAFGDRTPQGQRSAAAQARDHSELCAPMRL